MTETEFTDDMGNNPIDSVLEKKSEASRIQSEIDSLLNQVTKVEIAEDIHPHSVSVSYDEESHLGEITLYYEYYDE